ncbi:17311_t:CDS:2, partial [Entrophospora sp. SA101]
LKYSQFDLLFQLRGKLMSQTNNNSCGNAGPSPGCNSSNGILGSTSNFNDNKTSIVNTTVSSSPQSSTNMTSGTCMCCCR